MAEGFFNEYSTGEVKAVSAGTRPATEVNPTAVAVMKEIGIDISGQTPKALSEEGISKRSHLRDPSITGTRKPYSRHTNTGERDLSVSEAAIAAI